MKPLHEIITNHLRQFNSINEWASEVTSLSGRRLSQDIKTSIDFPIRIKIETQIMKQLKITDRDIIRTHRNKIGYYSPVPIPDNVNIP